MNDFNYISTDDYIFKYIFASYSQNLIILLA